MAAARRFSIALLMTVVFCIAVDIGIVRYLLSNDRSEVLVALVVLPMVNLLLLALPGVRPGRAGHRYWVGFEAAGWVMVVAFGLASWLEPTTFFSHLYRVDLWARSTIPTQAMPFTISVATILYTTPQLLVAMIGGRLAAVE